MTYLDPDIEVYADFAPLLEDAADLTLVPHFLSDIPADGERPSTYDVLMAGLYNLGFCSARPTSSAFLGWWAGRMQFECRNDHRRGYFTDQKILDMAPLKARVQVLRDPGMDVAYWNLHERRVVAREGTWGVEHEGRRSTLYFFHFSGFRLERHPSLSIHSSRPVLGEAVPRDFASGYDRRCRRARPAAPVPVTLAGAALSRALPAPWRRAIREDLEVHGRAGLSLRQVREEVYPGQRRPSAARRARARTTGSRGASPTSSRVGRRTGGSTARPTASARCSATRASSSRRGRWNSSRGPRASCPTC